MGGAFDMFLRYEEAEPVSCLPNATRQEVAVVPWNKHDRTLGVLREAIAIGNLSKNKGVHLSVTRLERVDTVYLLQHDTLN